MQHYAAVRVLRLEGLRAWRRVVVVDVVVVVVVVMDL